MTGGGSMLANFADLLAHETGLPVRLAENPLNCVALGAGRVLEERGLSRGPARHLRYRLRRHALDWPAQIADKRGMSWLTRVRNSLSLVRKRDTPDNLWMKCPACAEMLFVRRLRAEPVGLLALRPSWPDRRCGAAGPVARSGLCGAARARRQGRPAALSRRQEIHRPAKGSARALSLCRRADPCVRHDRRAPAGAGRPGFRLHGRVDGHGGRRGTGGRRRMPPSPSAAPMSSARRRAARACRKASSA